jgi:hypothetical protein
MPSRKHLLCLLAVAVGTLGPAGSAQAAKRRLKLRAPSYAVKLSSRYTITIWGHGAGKANFVVGYTHWAGGLASSCKSTYAAEYATHRRPVIAALSRSVHGKFRFALTLDATSPGHDYFCVYLINRRTGKTYLRRGAHYEEHLSGR